MKGKQSERDMIDAIRLMLGMSMLYAEERTQTPFERHTSSYMQAALGTGNRKIPIRNSDTKTTVGV